MYALPEYEPPRLPYPPDPNQPDDPEPWLPAPIAVSWSPPDPPVWDEPGPLRDRLCRLVAQVLEVLDNRRPTAQLRAVLDAPVYHSLCTRIRQSGQTIRLHRLRTLHTCQPVPGIIELCATVLVSAPNTRRDKVIALAARLEQHGNSWRCTVLQPLDACP